MDVWKISLKADTLSTLLAAGQSWIDIITDARHSTRGEILTCVVRIGIDSHKVVEHVNARREDDPGSERHDMYETKVLYETLDSDDTAHICFKWKGNEQIANGAMCKEGKAWSLQQTLINCLDKPFIMLCPSFVLSFTSPIVYTGFWSVHLLPVLSQYLQFWSRDGLLLKSSVFEFKSTFGECSDSHMMPASPVSQTFY